MTKTFADAIFEAEKHSKQAPKYAALSGLRGDELRLAQEALNPYRVFNIKKFDKPQAHASQDPGYHLFFRMLDDLASRNLSGNAARAAVTGILGLFTERTAKALERVLLKDLKCGATASTFKKLYPGVDFPSFELMLAAKIDEKPEATRKADVKLTPAILEKKYGLRFPMIAETKYDGKRLIAVVKHGSVKYWTRQGNEAEWCNGLFDDELVKLEQRVGEPIIVDGEVLGSSFSETAKAKGSDNDDAKENLKFYAFDWMTFAEWDAQSCPHVQHVRSSTLETMLKAENLTKVIKSKYRICHSIAELVSFYAEVLKDGIGANGMANGLGEGLIIKHVNGVYEWDRSSFWFKWKPVLDVDLKIVGFYEGDAGKKNEGKLGGLHLEGHDENGRFIRTNCGGFKVGGSDLRKWIDDKLVAEGKDPKTVNRDQWFRAYVWTHQSEFLGKIAMIEGQELSLAEGETAYAVRFPQFIRVRDDK